MIQVFDFLFSLLVLISVWFSIYTEMNRTKWVMWSVMAAGTYTIVRFILG